MPREVPSWLALLVAVLAPLAHGQGPLPLAPRMPPLSGDMSMCNPEPGTTVYNFTVDTLDGKKRVIGEFQNNYLDFNPLLERYNRSNFRILAFPCNQFDLQEPGENWEILNGLKYVRPGGGFVPHPNLTIFGKLEVNGQYGHDMYRYLKRSCPPTTPDLGNITFMHWNPLDLRDITWNFEKFLVDARGVPRYRFRPGNWAHGNVVRPFLDYVLYGAAETYAQDMKPLNSEGRPSSPIIRSLNNMGQGQGAAAPTTEDAVATTNAVVDGFMRFWRSLFGSA